MSVIIGLFVIIVGIVIIVKHEEIGKYGINFDEQLYNIKMGNKSKKIGMLVPYIIGIGFIIFGIYIMFAVNF